VRYRTIVLGVVMPGVLAGCERRGEAERFEGTPQVVEDSVLVFPSGVRHATNLRSLRYHDVLSTGADRPPFLVLSGIPRAGTASDRVVVVVRADRPAPPASVLAVFPYPGEQAGAASPDSVRNVRLFVGDCVPGGFGGVVQVTTSADSADAGAVVARQIAGDSLELVTETGAPSLPDVLAAVERDECREIPRLDQSATP